MCCVLVRVPIAKVCRIVVRVVYGVPGADTFVMPLVTVIMISVVMVFVMIRVVAVALTDAGQNAKVVVLMVVLVPPNTRKNYSGLYIQSNRLID